MASKKIRFSSIFTAIVMTLGLALSNLTISAMAAELPTTEARTAETQTTEARTVDNPRYYRGDVLETILTKELYKTPNFSGVKYEYPWDFERATVVDYFGGGWYKITFAKATSDIFVNLDINDFDNIEIVERPADEVNLGKKGILTGNGFYLTYWEIYELTNSQQVIGYLEPNEEFMVDEWFYKPAGWMCITTKNLKGIIKVDYAHFSFIYESEPVLEPQPPEEGTTAVETTAITQTTTSSRVADFETYDYEEKVAFLEGDIVKYVGSSDLEVYTDNTKYPYMHLENGDCFKIESISNQKWNIDSLMTFDSSYIWNVDGEFEVIYREKALRTEPISTTTVSTTTTTASQSTTSTTTSTTTTTSQSTTSTTTTSQSTTTSSTTTESPKATTSSITTKKVENRDKVGYLKIKKGFSWYVHSNKDCDTKDNLVAIWGEEIELPVYSITGDWYEVGLVNGETGWVYIENTALEKYFELSRISHTEMVSTTTTVTTTKPTTTATVTKPVDLGIVAGDKLLHKSSKWNLRDSMSWEEDAIVGELPEDAKVYVIEVSNRWLKIKYDHKEYYINIPVGQEKWFEKI